jgi:adenosylcobinamide-GDP ribazoletransferase
VLLALRQQALLLVVAIQFLTRLPMPALRGFRPEWLSASARYFPLVGVLVGAASLAVWWLASLVLPNAVAVGLMLAASLLLTGAFHEDGFADACDGFGGGTTPARVLEIMKDSRIGAYGAIGIAVMLGLKWTTLAAIPRIGFPLLTVSAHMFSRWCATGLIWRLSYVRVEGESKAKPFAGHLGAGEWLASGAIGGIAILAGALLTHAGDALAVRALGAAASIAGLVALIAAAFVRRRIGGYTGDVLGAVQQLTELGFLLCGLAVLGRP